MSANRRPTMGHASCQRVSLTEAGRITNRDKLKGVDGEERRPALAFGTLAAGDGGNMSASAFTEDVEGGCAVCVDMCAGGDVGITERRGFQVGEAANHRHGDRAHPPARMTSI